jgi:hypothetical protein
MDNEIAASALPPCPAAHCDITPMQIGRDTIKDGIR